MTHVSAAIIHNENDEILICQRKSGGNCGLLWEFPGGKQEPNESPQECLVRECMEELGVEICIDNLFAETVFHYPDRAIAFSFFDVHIINGTLTMQVHNDIKWVLPENMQTNIFCPADIEIVKKILQNKSV